MKYVDPPFERGDTLLGTDDDSNLINDHWEGQIFEHQDIDLTTTGIRTGKSRRTGRQITAMICRNTSGAALLGKRIGRLERDTTNIREFLGRVDGYADTLAEKFVVVIDDQLDSNGCAANDLFWGVIGGPVVVLSPAAGAAFNGDIAAHAHVVAATAATTQTSAAGRISNITLPGQTGATQAFSMASNLVGVALSAKTTGETEEDILIHATIKF